MSYMHSYLPLSSCPGKTISLFAMTLRREGGSGPELNVIMMLIKKKIVWKCPLRT